MATVRIYKVAELLGTTSQEVTALLKRDHGIEVKSASSTIEEVVARQFVERLARQRNISLPSGDIFAETPPLKGKKGAPAKKPAEPPKPAAPVLPPPRLVKTVKPIVVSTPEAAPAEEPEAVEEPVVEEPVEAEPVAVAEAALGEARVEPTTAQVPVVAEHREPVVPAAPSVSVPKAPPPGRVVPPTLRLRIEEQPPSSGAHASSPVPRVVPRPVPRVERPAAPPASARPAASSAGQTSPTAARPSAPPTTRPAGVPPRPTPYSGPGIRPSAPPGGPRPLPSQPIRAQQPGAQRPGQYPQRPGARCVLPCDRQCRDRATVRLFAGSPWCGRLHRRRRLSRRQSRGRSPWLKG